MPKLAIFVESSNVNHFTFGEPPDGALLLILSEYRCKKNRGYCILNGCANCSNNRLYRCRQVLYPKNAIHVHPEEIIMIT